MTSSAELKSVLKQQRISKVVDERFPSYQLHRSSKHQEQSKVKDNINGISATSKTSRHKHGKSVERKGAKDDELVKYMSKLPGYLQREQRGESFGGKALNVGVLDWTRLEKWKHSQKGGHTTACNNASASGINISTGKKLSSTNSGAGPKDAQCNQTHPSTCCYVLDSSSKDGLLRVLQSSGDKFRRFRESKSAPRDSLDEQKKTACNHQPPGINQTRVDPGKSRRTLSSLTGTSGVVNLSSDMGKSGISVRMKHIANALGGETRTRVGALQRLDASQKALDQRTGSEEPSVRDKKTKKRTDGFPDSETDLAWPQPSGQSNNVVLLRPRKHNQNTLPEEPQMSLNDGFRETKLNTFSDDSANQNACSSKLSSQIPRLCPMSSNSENKSTSGKIPLCKNLSTEVSEPPVCLDKRENKTFGSKNSEPTVTEARNTSATECKRILDQETPQEESRKSRHPSPTRRFSFSFSRISRSFSFKDDSVAQPLSSTYVSAKSGPVRSDGSACPNAPNPEKPSGLNRARSSPLRRLLDPLLKLKGKETALPCKESSTSSNPKPVTPDVLLKDEKQDTSMIHALVQLTIRNGLPLFKFVVDDNSSSILAATMHNASSSEKGDLSQHCTFYSVNEAKKKSGSWIGHTNKEKHCGFVYNITGQMRLCNSPSSALTLPDCDNSCISRESVLFESELKHADQTSEKIKTSKEIAAVVIKMPSENSFKAQQNDASMIKNRFMDLAWRLEENEDNLRATVILPAGVHGVPDKGVPSPLIDRWRSGGLCDCGGWDIGCRLRALSNHRSFQHFSSVSKAQSQSKIFQLFDQEGDWQNKPVFRMVPRKRGIYSVEFSSSISLLQAFYISVTVITSEKASDVSEFSTPPETKTFQDAVTNANKEIPVKFASNPPLSPVGRV